jgi:hypothetical protein
MYLSSFKSGTTKSCCRASETRDDENGVCDSLDTRVFEANQAIHSKKQISPQAQMFGTPLLFPVKSSFSLRETFPLCLPSGHSRQVKPTMYCYSIIYMKTHESPLGPLFLFVIFVFDLKKAELVRAFRLFRSTIKPREFT